MNLVDTSVWVDHLRKSDQGLRDLHLLASDALLGAARRAVLLLGVPSNTTFRFKLRVMRQRTKPCANCAQNSDALYRCRYGDALDWRFLCGRCLTQVKADFPETYQYGGTWKARKR